MQQKSKSEIYAARRELLDRLNEASNLYASGPKVKAVLDELAAFDRAIRIGYDRQNHLTGI